MIDDQPILQRMLDRQAELGLSLYQLDTEVGGRWPRRMLKGESPIVIANVHAMGKLLSTHPANLLRTMVPPVPEPEHAPWIPHWRLAQSRLRALRMERGLSVIEWARRAGMDTLSASGLRRLEYEGRGHIPWSRWYAMCAAVEADPLRVLYPDAFTD
jgi:hypothetical protein